MSASGPLHDSLRELLESQGLCPIGEDAAIWLQQLRDHTAGVQKRLSLAEAQAADLREAAQAAKRTKATFLANMGHELRTPLNAIIGYGELLQEEAVAAGSSELAGDAEHVLTAARHLLTLVADVLELSRSEAGRMKVAARTEDANAVFAGLYTQALRLASTGGNTLHWSVGDLGEIHTDTAMLSRVLLHLLSNAAKHTHKGLIQLEAQRVGAMLLLTLTDTGSGIDADRIPNVFEPFESSAAAGGRGLGLALSHRMVRALGGSMELRSTLGEGTRVDIGLPVRAPAQAPAVTIPPAPVPGRLPKLLVIDDDPVVHDLMQRYLARTFRVISALHGAEAIELALEHNPVAITLDVMMPGLDGWSTLAALKAQPELADTPIVMMSMLDERSRGLQMGASEYLTKPVSRAKLEAVLEPLLH